MSRSFIMRSPSSPLDEFVSGSAVRWNLAQAAFFGTGGTCLRCHHDLWWNPGLAAPVAVCATCAAPSRSQSPPAVQSTISHREPRLAGGVPKLLSNSDLTGGASGISKIPPCPCGPGPEWPSRLLILARLRSSSSRRVLVVHRDTPGGGRFKAMRDACSLRPLRVSRFATTA